LTTLSAWRTLYRLGEENRRSRFVLFHLEHDEQRKAIAKVASTEKQVRRLKLTAHFTRLPRTVYSGDIKLPEHHVGSSSGPDLTGDVQSAATVRYNGP
jgi:hypothetical protein